MRIAVLGSGAMGSIFGAALSRSGAEVVFFDRRADVVEAINRDGLRLLGVLGEFALRPSPPATRVLPSCSPGLGSREHPTSGRGRDGEGGRELPRPSSFPSPLPSPARGEGIPLATGDPAALGKVDVVFRSAAR